VRSNKNTYLPDVLVVTVPMDVVVVVVVIVAEPIIEKFTFD
jgi:hypothetical protein